MDFLKKEKPAPKQDLSFKQDDDFNEVPIPPSKFSEDKATIDMENKIANIPRGEDTFDASPIPPSQFAEPSLFEKKEEDTMLNQAAQQNAVDWAAHDNPFDNPIKADSQVQQEAAKTQKTAESQQPAQQTKQPEPSVEELEDDSLDLPDLPDLPDNVINDSLEATVIEEKPAPNMSKEPVQTTPKKALPEVSEEPRASYLPEDKVEHVDVTDFYVESRVFYGVLQDIKALKKALKDRDSNLKDWEDLDEKYHKKTEDFFGVVDALQEQLITIDTSLFEVK